MGTVLEFRKVSSEDTAFRLTIYCKTTQALLNASYSANRFLASEMIKYKPFHRTMKLESIFMNLLQGLPNNAVIKDIDVLFNPEYKIDVLKMLLSVYKRKRFSLIWSGSYSDGNLIYSEDSYSDYKTYNIKDYDIICVI